MRSKEIGVHLVGEAQLLLDREMICEYLERLKQSVEIVLKKAERKFY